MAQLSLDNRIFCVLPSRLYDGENGAGDVIDGSWRDDEDPSIG